MLLQNTGSMVDNVFKFLDIQNNDDTVYVDSDSSFESYKESDDNLSDSDEPDNIYPSILLDGNERSISNELIIVNKSINTTDIEPKYFKKVENDKEITIIRQKRTFQTEKDLSKYMKRRKSNNKSARESRLKRTQYYKELEQNYIILLDEIGSLKKEIEKLKKI